MSITKPQPGEYNEFYQGYLDRMKNEVDLMSTLLAQGSQVERLPVDFGEERAGYRYAEGKWSVREVVGHMVDAERIFAYRVLRIARGDQTPLPGFEENAYVAAANFESRTLTSVVSEWRSVREATLRLIESLAPETWERQGTASGFPVTVRAVAWIIPGHAAHHLAILSERYAPR